MPVFFALLTFPSPRRFTPSFCYIYNKPRAEIMVVVGDKHASQPSVDEMTPDEASDQHIDHEQTGSAQDRPNSTHSLLDINPARASR